MKKGNWVFVVAAICLLVAVPLAGYLVRAKQDADAFQKQIRLAREEGIPTNAAEFEAAIPKATQSENAAPYYRRLSKKVRRKIDLEALTQELTFNPTAKNLALAKDVINKHQDGLNIIDAAAVKPRCWFAHDWSQGAAVLFREYIYMKDAAKIVSLRGALAARLGDVHAAIGDAHRLFAIAKHAGEGPYTFSHAVGESIYAMGLQDLTSWAWQYRRPAYVEALKGGALNSLPKPNLREEHLGDLFFTLSAIDLAETADGRKELGIIDAAVPDEVRVAALLQSKSRAKVKIVTAQQALWKAIGRPQLRRPEVDGAIRDITMGFQAFPYVARMVDFLYGEDSTMARLPTWEAKKQRYLAALRALSEPTIPHSIKCDDLLSPFDQKPLRYRYDGRQIVIEVSGYKNPRMPILFKLPPDKLP